MLPLTLASPDEAYGIVTNVVDGDTFDVMMERYDPRIASSVERIRLADVDSPEMDSQAGLAARDLTSAVLINRRVYLDIDDLSGRDPYGRLICVVYLTGNYGQPLMTPSFNRMLVDSGHARVEDFDNNEFDPGEWWSTTSTTATWSERAELDRLIKRLEGFFKDILRKLLDELAKDLEGGTATSGQ